MLPSVRRIRDTLAAGEFGELPDGELLARFVSTRDEAAFELLVRRHQRLVWGVCHRMLRHRHDAEDAFQAVFLTLARKAKSVRSSRSLAGWLYRVAYRIALRAESRKRRMPRAIDEAEPLTYDRQQDPHLGPLLDEEVQRLPERYRLPVVLCYLEGHSYEEAARRLRWPKGTVSTRLTRARELLRERLSARGVTPAALIGLLAGQADAVPNDLVRRATHAGLSPTAAGQSAAVLSDEVIRAMTLSKLQLAIPLVAAGVIGFAAWGGKAVVAGPQSGPRDVGTIPTAADDEPEAKPDEPKGKDVLDELLALEHDRTRLRIMHRTQVAEAQSKLNQLEDEHRFEQELYLIRRRALAEKQLDLQVGSEELLHLAEDGGKEAQARLHALESQRRLINHETGKLEEAHRDRVQEYYHRHLAATRQIIEVEEEMALRERMHELRRDAKLGQD